MSKIKFIFLFGILSLFFGVPLISRGIEVSSPPSIPALSGGISFKNSPNDDINDVAVSNNYLYAALRRYDDNSKKFIGALKIFDASDHAAPLEIASHNVDANLNALFVEGNYLYAAGYSETDDKSFFYIFDISSPSAPTVVSSTELPADFHGANDIKVSGNYAYFVGETGGFGAIDISDVSAPIIKGIYDPGAVFYSIAVFGSNVSLLGNKDVYVFDISDQTSPVKLGIYNSFSSTPHIFISNGYAYVFGPKSINIIKVSNGVKNVSDNQTDDNIAATPWLLPDSTPDLALAGRMKGKILLQTESKGEAWYIHPKEFKRYYLSRPQDGFSVMRSKGYGISNANMAKIPSANSNFATTNGVTYMKKTTKTSRGDFSIDLLIADLSNPKVKILTDTAENYILHSLRKT